jgi:hypothetical protein
VRTRCISTGGRLGAGRDGIVKAGCFKGQLAAVKFVVPELAEDRASAAAAYNTEVDMYMVLQDLQGGIHSRHCVIQASLCLPGQRLLREDLLRC